jgi:hypothetical protein
VTLGADGRTAVGGPTQPVMTHRPPRALSTQGGPLDNRRAVRAASCRRQNCGRRQGAGCR